MKYADLHINFILGRRQHLNQAVPFADCNGLLMWCPVCTGRDGHPIRLWQPHAPPDLTPLPGRWTFVGTGADDLTLVAGSSSVHCTEGCGAHFYIRSGQVIMA